MEPLFHINDIPDNDSRGFHYQGQSLIAIRKNQALHLYLNHCPHLGLPLEWQAHQFLTTDKTLIQCSSHGALFTIDDGHCISGPCSGQSLTPIEFTIKDSHVFISPNNADLLSNG